MPDCSRDIGCCAHLSRTTLNFWLPIRMSSLAVVIVAANLAACAGGSSNSQTGYDSAQAQSEKRSGLAPFAPVTAGDQRTLACLHCAP